jgi:hypothetical protein
MHRKRKLKLLPLMGEVFLQLAAGFAEQLIIDVARDSRRDSLTKPTAKAQTT